MFITNNFIVNSRTPHLMDEGSSPYPGASDVGSTTKRNKNKQREFVFNTKSNRGMVLQQSKIDENNLFSSSTNTEEELERKIDSITTGLSRPYFNKILKELVKKNLENATIICDYIIAEQIEINIQNSTKESKIKVLTWLSSIIKNLLISKSRTHI